MAGTEWPPSHVIIMRHRGSSTGTERYCMPSDMTSSASSGTERSLTGARFTTAVKPSVAASPSVSTVGWPPVIRSSLTVRRL